MTEPRPNRRRATLAAYARDISAGHVADTSPSEATVAVTIGRMVAARKRSAMAEANATPTPEP